MADIVLTTLGASLNKDIAPWHLPPGSFTSLQNVRITEGQIESVGAERLLATTGGADFRYLFPVISSALAPIFIGGATKAYCFLGGAVTDITKLNSSYSASGRWSGAEFSNNLVVTNGVDVPQAWVSPNATTRLVNLVNWPSTRRARIMRSFLRVLIAMGLTDNSNELPYRILVSHPADPGALPGSWDETDPTKDVIYADIADTSDHIIDGLALGQSVFVIYKETTTWGMAPYGGGGGGVNSAFRLQPMFREFGLLSQDCVVAFGADITGRGSRHFLVSRDDIVVHNAASAQSVLTKKLRRWLFNNIDTTNYNKSFVVANPRKHEVRYYFPQQGSTFPNMYLMWNWDDGEVTIGDTTPLKHAATARMDSSDSVIDSLTGSIDELIGTIDPGISLADLDSLIGVHGTHIYGLDDLTYSSPVLSHTTLIERLDFPYGPVGQEGPVALFHNVKYYNRAWIRLSAPAGSQFTFQFGGRNEVGKDIPIVWKNPRTYTVGESLWVMIDVNKRYLSYRIKGPANTSWTYMGMTIEAEPGGVF